MRPTCTTLLALLAVLAFLFDSLHTVEQQTPTPTCFLVNGTASAPNPVPFASPIKTKVEVYVRKDSDSQLTILSGVISGAPVVKGQTLPINFIGGNYPHGYNPQNGKSVIKCNNNRGGGVENACRCALVTAFGFDYITTPTYMIAYAIDTCFANFGEWTSAVPVTAVDCP